MPLPTEADVAPLAGYPCPTAPLLLSAVTAAFNNADTADQAAFLEAIQPGIVTLSAMATAFENANQNDQTNFQSLLGIYTEGGGSGGAGGAPYVLTAQEIATAIDVNPDPVINVILNQLGIATGDPPEAPNNALNLYVNSQTQVAIQNNPEVTLTSLIPGGINLGARFVFGVGTNELDVVVNPVTKQLDITGVIYLGEPPAVNEPITYQPTPSQICLGGQVEVQMISVPVGDITGNAYFSFSMVQQLYQKLDQLLRCCEPCSGSWVDLGTFTGGQIIEPPYNSYLRRVRLDEKHLQVPIDLMPGIYDWKRYGRLAWIDKNGFVYDDVYIRYPGQIFVAPSADCVSVNLILNPGVSMELWVEYGPVIG